VGIRIASYSYADVVERLFAEFDGPVPLPAIVDPPAAATEAEAGSV